MPVPTVQAPISLLLDPNLRPTAKVIWLALQGLEPTTASAHRLADRSGLTLATIRSGLAQLEAGGWYTPSTGAIEPLSSARVSIPASLLPERLVRPQGRLLYGILQTLPEPRQFTYLSLSASARVSLATVKKAVGELVRAGWIQISQAHKQAPIRFTLHIPEQDRRDALLAQAERRLEEAEFRGEAIMKEYLSLLIESDEFEDNARPGFLVNPLTEERMELDRYYPTILAFEFNGPHHYRPTRQFPSQTGLAMQQARDLMKEALCTRRGIRLVVVEPSDLSIEVMQQKVGGLLPLRDLRGYEELILYLDRVSRLYRGERYGGRGST